MKEKKKLAKYYHYILLLLLIRKTLNFILYILKNKTIDKNVYSNKNNVKKYSKIKN